MIDIWLATHVVIILGVIQGPELVLKQNQLLTVLPYIGREYIVTFELPHLLGKCSAFHSKWEC